ncbi:hypothetical protein VPHK567_0285 [Vibrio phage K567]
MSVSLFEVFVFFASVIALVGIHALMCKWSDSCAHDWITVINETTKSQGELYGEATGRVPSPKTSYQLEELTKRKRIIIMKCAKCGKLDKTVETI